MRSRSQEDMERQVARCAILYYREGLQQAEIAKKLGISLATVSRLLKIARDSGIIKIIVDPPRHLDLEFELIKRWGLKDSRVVFVDGSESIPEILGMEAASFVEDLIEKNGLRSIAVSGGTTMLEFAESLRRVERKDMVVYSMAAALPTSTYLASNTIAGIIAAKWKARIFRYPFDDYVESIVPRKLIEDTLEGAKNADIMIMGIGNLSADGRLMWLAKLGYGWVDLLSGPDSIKKLKKELNAVGDVNFQIFDKDGNPIDSSHNVEHFVLSLKDIKAKVEDGTSYVIGVAGGLEKAKAIKAALKGRLINVLITDYKVAQRLASG
jgi:DNA-binding transcriptional regulator LsrR (DeoR family)